MVETTWKYHSVKAIKVKFRKVFEKCLLIDNFAADKTTYKKNTPWFNEILNDLGLIIGDAEVLKTTVSLEGNNKDRAELIKIIAECQIFIKKITKRKRELGILV